MKRKRTDEEGSKKKHKNCTYFKHEKIITDIKVEYTEHKNEGTIPIFHDTKSAFVKIEKEIVSEFDIKTELTNKISDDKSVIMKLIKQSVAKFTENYDDVHTINKEQDYEDDLNKTKIKHSLPRKGSFSLLE